MMLLNCAIQNGQTTDGGHCPACSDCDVARVEPNRRTVVVHYERNWTELASVYLPVVAKPPPSRCSRHSSKVII